MANSVEVTCSTQPSCTSRSSPVAITVEPQPLLARRLLGKKSGTNAVFSWTLEATATGGYRLYYTPDKKLVMTARAGTSNTFAAGTTAVDPNATTLTHTNALGLPDTLLHYQTLALCLDQVLEGPN